VGGTHMLGHAMASAALNAGVDLRYNHRVRRILMQGDRACGIELTDGRDLSAKVEYARGYAKLLYERELHDRLLNEVMAADPMHDGFTLSNVLAKEQAAALLAEADDYF